MKKLTVPAYLNLFLHAQLQQREGLRSIADDVLCKDFQQELGFESISSSQLCRKNNQVNPVLLEHLFEPLARKVLRSEGATPANRKAVQVIDSTTISLCLQRYFVTRLKNNAVIEPLESFLIPMESSVTMDERVRIGLAFKRAMREYRMIETADSEGNRLILVTNRFDLTCDEISDMYRSRWAIETFFKWMKQHLRIKRFYGTSEQAVQNQVWMALIAYCLLVLVKKKDADTTFAAGALPLAPGTVVEAGRAMVTADSSVTEPQVGRTPKVGFNLSKRA